MAWSRKIYGNGDFKQGHGDFNALEFAKILEQAYLDNSKRDGFKTKKSFAPSGLGYGNGTCARYWFLAFSGVEFEDTVDAMAAANMSNGIFSHERIQKLVETAGILYQAEREVLSDDPPIRGFADLIVNIKEKYAVGEFKTIKEDNYNLVKSTMTGLPYHVVQLLVYMRVLKLKDGFLLYENKNTNEFTVVPVTMTPRNEEYTDYLFQWMKDVYKNWQDGKLPTRHWTKSNKVCKYCPLAKACWAGEPGEIDIAPLEVRKS